MSATHLWAHPTFDTVGSTLGRICERLSMDTTSGVSGVVVIPWAPEAAWWPLVRHMTCVARFKGGSKHLEENRAGIWVPVIARRPSLAMSFPLNLGTVLPLDAVVNKEGNERSKTLLPGTLLYSLMRVSPEEAAQEEHAGELYMLISPYDGSSAPECAQLLRKQRRGNEFYCDMGSGSRRGLSLDKGRAWLPLSHELWVVNHFARAKRASSKGQNLWSSLTFDFIAAEREIRSRQGFLEEAFLRERLASQFYDEPAHAELERALAGLTADDALPMSGLNARREPASASAPSSPRRPPSLQEEDDGEVVIQVRPRQGALSVSGQPLVKGGYEGMKCAGCNRAFGPRESRSKITPGGVGMIHNRLVCLHQARAAMQVMAATEEVEDETPASRGFGTMPPVCAPCDPQPEIFGAGSMVRDGSDQRRQQWKNRTGPARQERVSACLAGTCGVIDETPMVCLGMVNGAPCPARVHGKRCAQLKSGHASLGCFLCPDCRVREIYPGTEDSDLPESALAIARITMLVQMSCGAEATGASYLDFQRLEKEFMESVGGLAGAVRPSDSANVFMMFMCWLVAAKERALSLESLVRTAGAVMLKTGRENLTRRPDVKALFDELKQRHGEESRPRTATTRRMMKHLLEDVIPERGGSHKVNVRMQLMFAMEIMLGLRVGEALAGGDFHGLLANHFMLLSRFREAFCS